MIHIGIDPGFSGALATIKGVTDLEVIDMPTVSLEAGKTKSGKKKFKREYDNIGVLNFLRKYSAMAKLAQQSIHAVVEEVHAMPKQGGVSNFSFGYGKGALLMALAAAGIPYTRVHPRTWQKVMLAGKSGKDKGAAVVRASELFPGAELYGPQGGIKDGRADALLMAKYSQYIHTTQGKVVS